jgi:hypothetical protein
VRTRVTRKQDKAPAPNTLASSSSSASASSSLSAEVTVCTWGAGGEGCWGEGGLGASMAGWVLEPDTTGLLACEYDLVICCVSPPFAPPPPSPPSSSGSLDPQMPPLPPPQSASGPDSGHSQEIAHWAESMAHAAVRCMCVVPFTSVCEKKKGVSACVRLRMCRGWRCRGWRAWCLCVMF